VLGDVAEYRASQEKILLEPAVVPTGS